MTQCILPNFRLQFGTHVRRICRLEERDSENGVGDLSSILGSIQDTATVPFLLRCRMSLASFSVTPFGATTSSSRLVMAWEKNNIMYSGISIGTPHSKRNQTGDNILWTPTTASFTSLMGKNDFSIVL